MNRKHLPKLEIEQLGKKGVAGWYFEPSNRGDGDEVIFQCPNNHRGGLALHSIETSGEINASILCNGNDYHEFCILDDWPSNLFKKAGNPIVEKLKN